ncbi:MAG: pilus assembly protein PilM [Candidatus Omnitrophota bacterium]
MAINISIPKIPFLASFLDGFKKRQLRWLKLRNVSLFVGKEYVDIVDLRYTVRGPRLANFVSVPIRSRSPSVEGALENPPGYPVEPPEEGSISSHEQTLTAIRRAWRESGLRSCNVISTLSEEEVILRYFQIPFIPRKDWERAVRFEARRYIPFTLDELVSDFSVIENRREKEKMEIVFVAAKKEIVARHLMMFSKAELEVKHLEALPFGFVRLLYTLNPQLKHEKCIGVVDIDGPYGSIILIKEGFPYLVRRAALGDMSGEGTDAVGEGTAEGFPRPSPFVVKILDELRLTARYYQNQFPGESISRVYVFGDGIKKETLEFLSRELNVPVIMENLSSIAGSGVPLRLAKTIGLGLWGFPGFDTGIELLPKKELVISRQTRLFKLAFLEGLGAAVALFCLFFIMSHYMALQKKTLESERDRKPVITALSQEELLEKKKDLTQKLHLYRNLFDRKLYWTKKLSDLGRLLPKGAWVTEISVDDQSDEESVSGEAPRYFLTIKGLAYASESAEALKIPSQFLVSLQEDKDFFEGFQEAKLVSVRRTEEQQVEVVFFEIRVIGGAGELGTWTDTPSL